LLSNRHRDIKVRRRGPAALAAQLHCRPLKENHSMNTRTLLVLMVATAAPATLAFAGDGSVPLSKPHSLFAPTAAEFSPMTRSERFRHYLTGLVDTESIFRAAASAGLKQAGNTPHEWGQGAEAYGERFGDAFAQHMIRRTLQYGVASALHEDNRYFLSGESGFFHRAKYAVKSTFLARHDNGDQYLSVSRLGGAAGAAFISRTWHPGSTNSAGDGAVGFGISIGGDVGFNLIREFWPDISHHFRKD
jgi:hypothetical protein